MRPIPSATGRAARVVVHRLLPLLVLLALMPGCLQPIEIDIQLTEEPSFNPRIRLDRQGLTPAQATRPPLHGPYRDGRSSGGTDNEVVSALHPVLAEGRTERLVHSNCYWTARRAGQGGDPVQLNWEMVLDVRRRPSHIPCGEPARYGACRMRHPETGEPVVIHPDNGCEEPEPAPVMTIPFDSAGIVFRRNIGDEPTPLVFEEDLPFFASHVDLVEAPPDPDLACPGTAADFVPFQGIRTPLALAGGDHGCGTYEGYHSACGARCFFVPRSDGTVQLGGPFRRAVEPVSPNLRVVDGSAVLRRVMTPQGSDHAWTTGTDSRDGLVRWHENFSPGAAVESARLFQRLPDGSEDELPLEEGARLVLSGSYPGPGGPVVESWACAGGPVPGGAPGLHVPLLGVPGVDCDGPDAGAALALTPTYALRHLEATTAPLVEPLTWSLAVADGLRPGAEVVLELHLRAKGGGAALRVTPLVDLGAAERGHRRQGRALVENVGWEAMQVDGVRLDGRDAADFTIRLPAGDKRVPLPFRLHLGGESPRASVPAGADEMPRLRELRDGVGAPHLRAAPPAGADGTSFEYLGTPLTWDGDRLTYEDLQAALTFADAAEGFHHPFALLARDGFAERTMPFLLLPGETAEVLVSAVPAGLGERRATVEIDAHPPVRPSERHSVRSTLVVDGLVGPALELFPATPVHLPAGSGARRSHRRNVLLVNSGDRPAERTGVSLEGPDAAFFTLVSANPPDQRLEPGTSELFGVRYTPSCLPLPALPPGEPLRRRAELVLTTSEGVLAVPLVGWWDDTCL